MTDQDLAQLHIGEITPPPADQSKNYLDRPKPANLPSEKHSALTSDKTRTEQQRADADTVTISPREIVNRHRAQSKKKLQRTKFQSKDDVKVVLNEPNNREPSHSSHQPQHLRQKGFASSVPNSIDVPMSPPRFLIASLGNPAPYLSTRHSAGHVLLKALHAHLLLPPFHKSKPFANGLLASGAEIGRPEFTLWQSPSMMNVSGVALLQAYRTFTSTAQMSPTDPLPGLVVMYDEMETSPGQLRLRRGATSAKGHNGLKSVQQSLHSAGLMNKLGNRFIKIGIGIGRPAGGSRSSEDVSQYVLSQLTGSEKQMIDGRASELVQLLEAEISKMTT